MTSDRMMQAIGRIERAITRLETAVTRKQGLSAERTAEKDQEIARLKAEILATERHNAELLERERDRQENAPAFIEQDPHAINAFSHDKALAALRSLDSLIDDLQKARRDG
ncbi:MAG TPA: hypothetical protein VF503_10490 [Sphingobium sp.]|uniref:hypothetical protein n=1 Tax=Sphingobium sp. TaxID=1912891 RepID=UPI002ED6B22C